MSKDSAKLQENLTRINDVLVRTTTSANTNMEDLFEAVKSGAPAATAAGADVETFASLVGVLANAGMKGSEAGTALRNAFINLQAPAGAGAKALRRLGVQVEENGKMRDMVAILGDLTTATAGMSDVAKTSALNDIFGKRGITAIINLMNAGSSGIEEFRDKLRKAQGSSAEMAAEIRGTTSKSFDKLKSVIDSVQIEIFSEARVELQKIVDKMTEWIGANRDLIKSKFVETMKWLVDNGPQIVEWMGRLGRGVAAFYALQAAIKLTNAALIVTQFLVLANPFTLIVTAIAAAIVLLATFWPEVKQFFSNMANGLRIAGDWIKQTWSGVMDWFAEKWAAHLEFAVYLAQTIRDGIKDPIGLLRTLISDFLAWLGGALKGGPFGLIGELYSKAANFIAPDAAAGQPEGTSGPGERGAANGGGGTKHEVVIRDQTGRAEHTKHGRSTNHRVRLVPSGSPG